MESKKIININDLQKDVIQLAGTGGLIKKPYSIFIESFCYDNIFQKIHIETPPLRGPAIQKYKNKDNIFVELEKIKDIYSEIKNNEIENQKLICYLLIDEIEKNWKDIFGIRTKKISFGKKKGNFDKEYILKKICDFLYNILKKEPFLILNYSRGIIITNYLLNIIDLPGINFYYKDRKRIFRSLDSFIDFEKEFILTITSELNKILYTNIYPEKITSLQDLRKERNIAGIYIKPGTSWYGDDRKKYTFIK